MKGTPGAELGGVLHKHETACISLHILDYANFIF